MVLDKVGGMNSQSKYSSLELDFAKSLIDINHRDILISRMFCLLRIYFADHYLPLLFQVESLGNGDGDGDGD